MEKLLEKFLDDFLEEFLEEKDVAILYALRKKTLQKSNTCGDF